MIRSIFKQAAASGPLMLLVVAGSAAGMSSAHAGNTHSQTASSQQGSLPSLRGAAFRPDDFSRTDHARPARRLPFIDGFGSQIDGAVQATASGTSAPALGTGVPGLGVGFSGPAGSFNVRYAPPDTTGAVGATQYVQVVNTGLAVFDKATKSVVLGPVPTNTLWQSMTGPCHDDNDGDAVVVYDKAANRWVISQFAVTAAPYYQCVAVSKTSDATGGYWLYAFNYGSLFPDYPKIGVWPDAYYITFNMFTNTFQGAQLCAYDRAKMLTGAAATQQCFQLSTSYGGVLPADQDGATQPSAGTPNYMLNFAGGKLNLWKFHVDWAAPSNTTLSGPIGIPVASFAAACGGGTCIPQPGVSQKLDSLADRLMYRLAYRKFSDHESLVVTHSVNPNGSTKNPRKQASGVRWYEIRDPGTTPVVYQQATYAPDSTFRWMGSAAMDKQGNMAVGYSASSSSVYPSIRYTGRLVGDPLSTLQGESSILEGLGSQTGQNLSRWGDYSTLTLDPADDCTFWYSTEYLRTNGAFNWSTQIASFKFPGCI